MSKESSEELAKLAAIVLNIDDDDLIGKEELLEYAKRLAGSVLSQYEENE